MKIKKILNINLLFFISISLLIVGFVLDEDLSTGGSKLDFEQTWGLVEEFTKLNLENIHNFTRHFPIHYLLMAFFQSIFDNIYIARLLYFLFSLSLPYLIYINLKLLYPKYEYNILLLITFIYFLPFFRSSSIWPNAHLTAIIFLTISNFFFLKFQITKKFKFVFFNIFFLSLATYSIQSYVVFFIFYLYRYYLQLKFTNLRIVLILCLIFSIPGLFLILKTPVGSKLDFSNNLPYTVITNISITFFFIIFFLFNIKNIHAVSDFFKKKNILPTILLLIFYMALVMNYKNFVPGIGGGFFYKISFYFFKNELIFFSLSFLGLITLFILFTIDKNLFLTILLVNITSIAYYTSQKYFEPLLIIIILIMTKNFLTENIVRDRFNCLVFYFINILYYTISLINLHFGLTKSILF
jgi:hypothetical protein